MKIGRLEHMRLLAEARGLALWPQSRASVFGALTFGGPQIIWCRGYLTSFMMQGLQAIMRLQTGTARSGMHINKAYADDAFHYHHFCKSDRATVRRHRARQLVWLAGGLRERSVWSYD